MKSLSKSVALLHNDFYRSWKPTTNLDCQFLLLPADAGCRPPPGPEAAGLPETDGITAIPEQTTAGGFAAAQAGNSFRKRVTRDSGRQIFPGVQLRNSLMDRNRNAAGELRQFCLRGCGKSGG